MLFHPVLPNKEYALHWNVIFLISFEGQVYHVHFESDCAYLIEGCAQWGVPSGGMPSGGVPSGGVPSGGVSSGGCSVGGAQWGVLSGGVPSGSVLSEDQ